MLRLLRKLIFENVDGTRVLYADNDEYCPITYEIQLKLNNMKSSVGANAKLVIPARVKKQKLLTLQRKDRFKPASAGTKGIFILGDTRLSSYDTKFKYHLPYLKGRKFRIWQGYNGKFSHRGRNALDFDMPYGTTISAIRDGVVD